MNAPCLKSRPAVQKFLRVARAPAGMLDDATAGLIAIQKCGGITVVQDPKDAAYPERPQSAHNNFKVDHVAPLVEMGPLLEKLIRKPLGISAAAFARVVASARF
jgi:chemotaxis response regulator CheB